MRLFFLFFCFFSSVLVAQDSGDQVIFDKYSTYLKCLSENKFEIFNEGSFTDEQSISEIYGMLKPEVKDAVFKSIEQTFDHIEVVESQSNSKVMASFHLEQLFTALFERHLAANFSLKPCHYEAVSGYFDYIDLMSPFVNRVKSLNYGFVKGEHKTCKNKKIFFNDYLFKVAVVVNRPEFVQYVDNDVLRKKYQYILDNDLEDPIHYISEIIKRLE